MADEQVVVVVNDNQVPVLMNDSFSASNCGPAALDVLENDTDADGDTLYIVSTETDDGKLTVVDDKLIFETKNRDQTSASIRYIAADGVEQQSASVELSLVCASSSKSIEQPPEKQKPSGGSFCYMIWLLLAIRVRGLWFSSSKITP